MMHDPSMLTQDKDVYCRFSIEILNRPKDATWIAAGTLVI